jgi:outer membrane protein OmpU
MPSKLACVRGALLSAGLLSTGIAHAQSSVTLFGIVDVGVTFNSNIGGQKSWSESNNTGIPSQFGLLGKEDLGDGTSAIFKLATIFKPSTGAINTAGEMFSQEAFVGLSDTTYGTIKLGRIRQFATDLAPYVAAHGSIFGFHPGNFDQIVQSFFNNAVSYESPIYRGLDFGAMYGFGSTAQPATNTGRAYGFKIGYRNGGFKLQSTLSNINGITINPASVGLPFAFGKPASATIANGIALDNLLTTASSISYQFGKATVYGIYAYTNMSAYHQTERLQTGEVDVTYQLTPTLLAGGGYDYSVGMGGRWHIYNASLHYFLSARTSLNLETSIENVTGHGQKAALLFQSPSSNSHQMTVTASLIHSF